MKKRIKIKPGFEKTGKNWNINYKRKHRPQRPRCTQQQISRARELMLETSK